MLAALREHFKIRLFEALGDEGPVTLLVDGQEVYARTAAGTVYNLLESPGQPLLVLGQPVLETLRASVRGRPRRKTRKTKT